jgi:hypothetical protein
MSKGAFVTLNLGTSPSVPWETSVVMDATILISKGANTPVFDTLEAGL